MRLRRIAMLPVLLAALAAPLRGQRAGDGYLFGAPDARLSLRAGYAQAFARSDVFDDAIAFLTLERRSFSGPSIGGDLAITVAPWLDVAVSADYSASVRNSEDRGYLENGQPIVQTTSFRRVPLTANAIVYLVSRGRSIGTLAWIPAKVVPWIGGGGGTTWYRFRQEGDFVDYRTLNIFAAKLESSGWAGALQALGGVDISLSPRFVVSADARRTWAGTKPGRDFTSYDRIDLSGVTGSLGVTIRL